MTTEKQRAEILKLSKKIAQNGGNIATLGKRISNVEFHSTGIEDLDNILGGGLPKGRMIEIWGVESGGKTSLALHLSAQYDTCLYIPAEGTFDAGRASVFGNRPKQLIIYQNKYGEDAMSTATDYAKLGIPLIVIDSVPFLIPKSEIERASKNLEDNQKIAPIPQLMNKSLPALNTAIESTGTTIVFINQVRDIMGAVAFGEQLKTTGGHLLKHCQSIRLQVARRSWIEIPNKNPANSAVNEKIGLIMKCKVVKSKVCPPYGECEIPMLFDRGFVNHDEAIEIRNDLMKSNRRRKKGGD